MKESTKRITLTPADNPRLASLCGQFDEHLHLIERHLGVEINNRGNEFEIIGIPISVDKACKTLEQLYFDTDNHQDLSTHAIQLLLKSIDSDYHYHSKHTQQTLAEACLVLSNTTVKPRTPNQRHYIKAIQEYDLTFGIGPSGTGKTFLAIACAVAALENEQVGRIVLVRPAVEAGESLGFLPGDLAQKIDPYLRPLYDALYEAMGINKVARLLEEGMIEIAPLAYMRGRTLSEAFVILDEAQNSTREQMKMFLTRIGFGSKAVVTGDITQIDLPKTTQSGLRHAAHVLKDIPTINFTFFRSEDVVRHPLVQTIIDAYDHEDPTS